MTKRAPGKFKLVENEYYPTPDKAIEPLIPYLHRDGVRYFVEPCCGDGRLADYLGRHGFLCVNRGDIEEGYDARFWRKEDFAEANVSVTNPPWSHKLMVEIMFGQSEHIPAWFLIKSDWLFTKQSTEIVKLRCTDIVPIGRVKWIEDSPSVGFDNCCWVRMDKRKDGTAVKFWPFP